MMAVIRQQLYNSSLFSIKNRVYCACVAFFGDFYMMWFCFSYNFIYNFSGVVLLG